ncbi:MAG: nucleotidyltransferase [Spirochaetae bacterium HGW-Spirochaetae-1]|jgi:hypothetical protein|nr:MAG: nucleotidyltransferase [Spirochaetae bacterium HGW-Spirochaetae-1]
MNQEIVNTLRSSKKYMQDTYNITKLGVFGSFARGDERADSDVDILVEFALTPGMKEFFGVEEYIENLLKRKIDLVREKGIRPELKENILSEVIFI